MKNTLKTLGLVGLLALGGCSEKKEIGTPILQSEDGKPLAVYMGNQALSYALPTEGVSLTKLGKERAKKLNIPESQFPEYLVRFGLQGIERLSNSKITPDIAMSYPKRMNAYDVAYLVGVNVTPNQAEQFHEGFSTIDIEYFIKHNIKSDVVNPFGSDFSSYQNTWPDQIVKVAQAMTPEHFRECKKEHLTFDDSILLSKSKVDVNTYRAYNSVSNEYFMNPSLAVKLIGDGITPDLFKQYIGLNKTHGTKIQSWSVPELVKSGIPIEEIKRKAKESEMERLLFGK